MKIATSALVALGLFASTVAFAQAHNHATQAHTTGSTPRPAAAAIENANENARFKAEFGKYDRNRDGKLTRREMSKHPMLGHFKMMDINGDGYISFAEYIRKH